MEVKKLISELRGIRKYFKKTIGEGRAGAPLYAFALWFPSNCYSENAPVLDAIVADYSGLDRTPGKFVDSMAILVAGMEELQKAGYLNSVGDLMSEQILTLVQWTIDALKAVGAEKSSPRALESRVRAELSKRVAGLSTPTPA